MAGHETTANGLAWALYLLSGDPQAQAWAREEARAAWAQAGDDPELFNPENFDPEAKRGRHRFQYLPFGAGPPSASAKASRRARR